MLKRALFSLAILFLIPLYSNNELNLTNEEKKWIKDNPTITYSEINWKPLSIIKYNKMEGIMGDYLKIISQRTGLKFEFVPSNSWSHVLQQFKDKKIDIVPGIGSSPYETSLGLTSKMYSSYSMVIVTSQKYDYIDSLNDLSGKKVAVPKDYTSYNFMLKNYPSVEIVTTKSIPEALLLVEKGKAEAFIGHIATSLYYIAENHLKNLKVSGTTSFRFEHRYLIQKENPILVSIINKVITSISYEEKKNIYSKWIQPTIIEKSVDYTLFFVLLIVSMFLFYRHYVLNKSFKLMTSVLNTTIDGIILSKNGKCIDINDSALKMLDYKKEHLINKDIFSFIVDKDKQRAQNALKQSYKKPTEVKLKTKRKRSIYILLKSTNIFMNNNKIRVHSFVDLTETKEKEAILFQQTKMAAMGEMIGNIAHQWRQPLSTISVAATGIKIQKELGCITDKELISAVEAINNSSQYLSRTIDDFRNFFSPSKKVYKECSINEVIEDALKLVKSQFTAKDIHILKSIDDIRFKTIKNELIQALINILNNSRDALLDSNNKKLILIETFEKENTLFVKIQDSAGGIKEEIVERVFEPYFTTKHQSQGTGIGLYMTEEIITKHLDGEISVTNKELLYKNNRYLGACFTITLPIVL